MQIFNTMSRQKEEFVPQTPGEYRIYVCGPTVYNYIHIGNARPMIVFDTLRRYLEYCGNKVYYVSNITDIDDKLIKKGQEEGTSMQEVARKFEADFFPIMLHDDHFLLQRLPQTFRQVLRRSQLLYSLNSVSPIFPYRILMESSI